MRQPTSKAAQATGLLIPRLSHDVPIEFGEDESVIIKDLLNAGYLKPDDRAASTSDHIEAAIMRTPISKFADMSAPVRVAVDKGKPYYGVDVWGDCFGWRIDLSDIIPWPCDRDLLRWIIGTINDHPFVFGPERWGEVVEWADGHVETAGTPDDYSHDLFKSARDEADDAAMLARLPADLATAYADFIKSMSVSLDCSPCTTCFCSVQFNGRGGRDPLVHWLDYVRENDQGDCDPAFSFGGTIKQFVRGAEMASAAIDPVMKLITWKSNSTPPDSASALLSWYTSQLDTPGQQLLPLTP